MKGLLASLRSRRTKDTDTTGQITVLLLSDVSFCAWHGLGPYVYTHTHVYRHLQIMYLCIYILHIIVFVVQTSKCALGAGTRARGRVSAGGATTAGGSGL